MRMIGEAMLITWYGFGLTIDKELESQEELLLYVSVPEKSYKYDVHNNEMSGDYLAKRFKEILTEMGVKRLKVKYRIRMGEYWTKDMGDSAMLMMKKKLFGSQY